MRTHLHRGLTAAVATFLTSAGLAFTVTGQVQNQSSLPVSGVNIDFIDLSTGTNLALSGDTTDAAGAFSVDVPAGSYRVTYTPPEASGLAGAEQASVSVTADRALSAATLEPGWRITLQTISLAAAPLADVKADFTNASSVGVFAPSNTSDVSGAISTVVPQSGAPYSLRLRDVGGRGLADKELLGLAPAGDTNLGPVVVGPARSVTGRTVRYSDSSAVATVNIDLVDSCGLELKLQGDLSDGAGNFNLTGVGDGIYQLFVRPPSATGLARREFRRVEIGAPLALGDVKLGSDQALLGRVVNGSGTALEGIDLNLTDEGLDLQVELNNDNTTETGGFLVQASSGTYQVDFRPPTTIPVAPKTLFGVTLTGTVDLGTVVLGDVILLSGTVKDANGAPVDRADLNVIDRSVQKPVFTPGDKSDSSGAYAARLAEGTWDLVFSPPASRPDLGTRTYAAQTISANGTLNVVLPSATSSVADWQMFE